MSTANVLFFSNNCEASKQLISMMQTENIFQFFFLICTDDNKKIPEQITTTPTLLIKGIPYYYVAGDAFAWLAKAKQWKINRMIMNMNNAQEQYWRSINNNLVKNTPNILGFSKVEMDQMSDMFSFFSSDINKECQESFPQSYTNCNNDKTESIFTPPLESGDYKASKNFNKLNETKQKKLYNNLLTSRLNQETQIRQNIEKFKQQYSNK